MIQFKVDTAYWSSVWFDTAIIILMATRSKPPVSVRTLEINSSQMDSSSLKRTVVNHLNVFRLRGANQILSPVKVHSLTSMKVEQLVCE